MSYETRALLAAAYVASLFSPRRKRGLEERRTHTVLDEIPLCRTVRTESLADPHASDVNAPPTCPICLRRDPRFKKIE